MKKILSILLCISFLFLLLSCQKTPVEKFVQPKNDSLSLEKKITEAEDENNAYEAVGENTYMLEKEYKSGNKLFVNASPNAGDTNKISVLSVKKKDFESGNALKETMERLYPGYDFYQYRISAEEYLNQLLLFQKLLECEKKGEEWIIDGERIDSVPLAEKYQKPVDENNPDADDGITDLENLEALVEQYTALYQKAVKEENQPTDFLLKETDEKTSKQANILETCSDDSPGWWVSFVNWDDVEETYFSANHLNFDSKIAFSWTYTYAEDFPTDAEFLNAKKAAEDYIEKLGIDYMTVEKVSSGNYDNHRFYFSRDINGFHENVLDEYFLPMQGDGEDREAMSLWRNEYAYVEVWDGVVQEVCWTNASTASVDAENVEVLPWEEIKNIFEKQIDYLLTPQEMTSSPIRVDIERIELGYTKLLMKDTNEYKLIPTWNFIGRENLQPYEYCFLTINAIDGTTINRRLMY